MTAIASAPTDPLPTDGLIACPHCDTLYRRVGLRPGERARCRHCGARLYGRSRLDRSATLALVLTALIAFIIANACPIVTLTVQGLRSDTTLIGAVTALGRDNRWLVAALVATTTLAVPLVDLGILLALLATAGRHRRPAWFVPLLSRVHHLRPWSMVEVFLLGVVVSLVKLSHLARVIPGAALWAFAALVVLLALIQSFHLDQLWDDEG